MATITISAPATRRTVVERRPVAPRSASARALGHDTATLVIPSAATVYASSGLLGHAVVTAAPAAPGSVRPLLRSITFGRSGCLVRGRWCC